MLVFYPELGSDMSKSTNTVVYFDWKTVEKGEKIVGDMS
jgi:hypothetical protein